MGNRILVDVETAMVYAKDGEELIPVSEIQGMKFEILRELAAAWYRSPGEMVPFSKLERYSEGDDPRASLRVRIREIKDVLGVALGVRFAAGSLSSTSATKGTACCLPEGSRDSNSSVSQMDRYAERA